MQLQQDTSRADHLTVLADSSINEELASRELLHEIEARIADGTRVIEFDCVNVPVITTVGIALLVKLHTAIQSCGGDLRLIHLSAMARDVLRIARLDHLLHINGE